MKFLIVFILFTGNVFGEDDKKFSKLFDLISIANCSQLRLIDSKLSHHLTTVSPVFNPDDITLLLQLIDQRLLELSCQQQENTDRRRRQSDECLPQSIGDGWCDIGCNVKEKEWDGGDCCPHTCTPGKAFPCGSGGYQCKGSKKIPIWFAARTQLCYKWYADGNGGQCGDGVSTHLCAGVNHMTTPYRDDTDGRPGGCRMSWGLETTALDFPEWFRQTAICFRWFADGDGGQCGGGAPAETCANLGSYTEVYRDDSDSRPGGCQMSWRLHIPPNADYWAQELALCYQWEPDGDGGQCGGGAERRLCAAAGAWTPYYRDDTDHRGGGCRMQWGLVLN